MVSYIITKDGISLTVKDKPFVISRNSILYEKVLSALKTNMPEDELLKLCDVDNVFTEYSFGEIKLKNGVVYYKDQALEDTLCKRIIQCIKDSVPWDNLRAFITRLMANTSKRAIDNLYKFLEYANLPITPSGTFLAYKAVKSDLYDIYSGTVKNTIGAIISMPRHDVDDDPACGCSYGFHVGTLTYAQSYGSSYAGDYKLLIVEVDPADVVCVPYDSSYQKVRTCKYTVRSLYEGPLPSSGVDENLNAYDNDEEEEFDEATDDVSVESSIVEVDKESLNALLDNINKLIKQLKE